MKDINSYKSVCFLLTMGLRKLLGLQCVYAARCDLYYSSARTCRSRDARGGYCGKFRKFEAEEPGTEFDEETARKATEELKRISNSNLPMQD